MKITHALVTWCKQNCDTRLKHYALRIFLACLMLKPCSRIKEPFCFKRLCYGIVFFLRTYLVMIAGSCLSTLQEIYAKARFRLTLCPVGFKLEAVSGSVNTQMWDNTQSALTVRFQCHARVQAPGFRSLEEVKTYFWDINLFFFMFSIPKCCEGLKMT